VRIYNLGSTRYSPEPGLKSDWTIKHQLIEYSMLNGDVGGPGSGIWPRGQSIES